MKLEDLRRHWQDYGMEFWRRGKLTNSVVLRQFYFKCELSKIRGSKGKPMLKFYPRHDDGSWSSGEPHYFRCDKNGNCYMYNSYSSNINRFRWIKVGRFVKINSK